MSFGDGRAGIEMRLVLEEERAREATGEVRFERAERLAVEGLEMAGAAPEAGEFRQIARRRDE